MDIPAGSRTSGPDSTAYVASNGSERAREQRGKVDVLDGDRPSGESTCRHAEGRQSLHDGFRAVIGHGEPVAEYGFYANDGRDERRFVRQSAPDDDVYERHPETFVYFGVTGEFGSRGGIHGLEPN